MLIRAGYEIAYDCRQPTPMLLMLSVHPSRLPDLRSPHRIALDPAVAARDYEDGFGNTCTRVLAPAGRLAISADFLVEDPGTPDPVVPDAEQHAVEDLPDEAMVYLLGSRYCDTDRLSDTAWSLFGDAPRGWGRVQAVCDYVHDRVAFGYEHASQTRTAWGAFMEQRGVCRDFAHLAVAFCRCMNIPARYCTGYLGGRWHTFDARHNVPRVGRIVMARGRDATDVAISTAFGPAALASFRVVTEEVAADGMAAAAAAPPPAA